MNNLEIPSRRGYSDDTDENPSRRGYSIYIDDEKPESSWLRTGVIYMAKDRVISEYGTAGKHPSWSIKCLS